MSNCAYYTGRSYAAQRRNYKNCSECKKARQKCDRSDSGACKRCARYNKICSLVDSAGLIGTTNAESARYELQSSPVEEDVQRFGVILYILPIDGNGLVEITHVRMGVNGQNQVFRSRCDKDNKPVAMPVYLGPWDEYLSRMQASMATVHIQDMETCAEQLGTD